MEKISIYVYDKKNRDCISSKIRSNYGKILSGYFALDKFEKYEREHNERAVYIDMSMLFLNEERVPDQLGIIEGILEIAIKVNNHFSDEFVRIMMEKRCFPLIKDYLYYKIDERIR